MIKKRFHYDWKTERMKDTQSNWDATSNMRILETIINDACYSYEKKIKELEQEIKEQETKIKNIKERIDSEIKQREEDLKKSIKAGMPSGLMYSEIELLEELQKIL